MRSLHFARKCSSRIQFCGKLSTASSYVVDYDKPSASTCSVSDEEPAKLSENGRCLTAIHSSADDRALDAPLDTYCLALDKCIDQKNLALGLKLHSLLAKHGHELTSFLGTSLIRLFAACGTLHQADQAFCKLHKPSVFAWGAIILAHSKHGLSENAIKLYETFLCSNLQPDGHIYVAALQACANGAGLVYGRHIHAQIIDSGLLSHTFVLNGIINMYLKCHSFYDAFNVFDTSPTRDTVTWNMMLEGCNQHGRFHKTLLLFNQMQTEGFLLDNVTFVSVLQASSCVESLQQGKMIHVLTFERGVEKDVFIGSSMIHMYCKCGRLDDALEVFDKRREVRDIVIWRAMLTGYASCGHFIESYELFCQIQQQEGLEIGKRTYTSILNACSSAAALHYGELIHISVVESGLIVDRDLGQALIGLYTNCGKPELASKVFSKLHFRDAVTWTAIMSGYADQGHCLKVLQLLCQMYDEGIKADEVVFSTVLKAASIQGSNLDLVRVVHTFIQIDSLESDFYIRKLLVEFYARFEMYEDADWIVYNSTKELFCTQECFIDSAQFKPPNKLLEEMAVSLLHLCSILEDLAGAQLVHFLLMECDYKWMAETIGSLISIYASCGMLDDACRVFDTSRSHPLTVWSSMIAGYSHHGRSDDAFQLFCRMQDQGLQLDESVCLGISKAFFTSAYLIHGRMLHTRIGTCKVGSDRVLSITLIEMYARCGSLIDAHRVFDKLLFRDTMAWNALIAGYASGGYIRESFKLFQAMQETGCKSDATTCIGILKACSSTSLLYAGKLIHHFVYEHGFDLSISLGNSLTNMYVKCGSLDDAESLLNWLPYQSKATWSLVISGHAENGNYERALLSFREMQRAGLMPDSVSIVSALKACSTLIDGMLLHSFLLLGRLKFNIYLANTLITMYSNCGSLEDATKMFDFLRCKDTATWNAMIASCAHNNKCELAWHYFKGMENEDVRPDAITFLCILSVCSHMGNVKGGLHQFHCMIQQHGITPTAEHYNCVIDLLGRAGSLLKAEDLLCSLPFLHNYVGWMSLLGHCKLHESTGVGGRCIDNIVKDENRIASGFTLMERVFFYSGAATEADDVEGLRKDLNAWKLPGVAHIEVNNSLFSFCVQRAENFPSNSTDEKVVRLKLQMKDRGYLPCF